MIAQGITLTGIGMSFVFLFLILLIVSMNGLAKFVRMLDVKYPEKSKEAPAAIAQDNSVIAIAIAAACKFTQKV